MEYQTQASLTPLYPDMFRTSERGFVLQYDLQSDQGKIVVECKRLKAFSWNQLSKFYYKCKDKAPERYTAFLVFKANRQPALVMHEVKGEYLTVNLFADVFNTDFVCHKTGKVIG